METGEEGETDLNHRPVVLMVVRSIWMTDNADLGTARQYLLAKAEGSPFFRNCSRQV